jgi:uncharacterized protein YicC (UPF0701 family)
MAKRPYAGASRTPRQLANYARVRLDKIDDLLAEIAVVYGGIDNYVEEEVDRLRNEVGKLRPSIDEAESEGRTL